VAVTSARIGLAVGGVSCLVAAGIGVVALTRLGMLHGRVGEISVAPRQVAPPALEPSGEVSDASSVTV